MTYVYDDVTYVYDGECDRSGLYTQQTKPNTKPLLLCILASFAVYTGLFSCVYRPLLMCIQASFAVYIRLFCCVYRPLLLCYRPLLLYISSVYIIL